MERAAGGLQHAHDASVREETQIGVAIFQGEPPAEQAHDLWVGFDGRDCRSNCDAT
jgi:hypothetical protein